jgi:hypothetical protein
VVTYPEVRALCLTLPRTDERVVYRRIKYRIGAIVYLGMSEDETSMGFGFPKEERDAMVESRPDTFFLPRPSDLRFNWICAWLAALDHEEMTELVLEAWRMCVPKKVAREHFATLGRPL